MEEKPILNGLTWHMIILISMALINALCYDFRIMTYNPHLWPEHFYYRLTIRIVTNVCIVLGFIILWEILNWGCWKTRGIVLVVIYSTYFMFIFNTHITFETVFCNVIMFISAFAVFASWGKPGNIADKAISKYMDIFEADRFPTDYETQVMSLKNYYEGDMEPYEVLYEQVRVMLDHELLDEDAVDILSAKPRLNESEDGDLAEIISSINLNNPKYNPLHPDNKSVGKYESNKDMLEYIRSGLRTDFIQDYNTALRKRENTKYTEKPFPIMNVEKTMRECIEELDQPEMLLTYCMIALYKNAPAYNMKFSLCAARTYAALYIQSGIVKFDDFFVDLIALLGASGIIETEQLIPVV